MTITPNDAPQKSEVHDVTEDAGAGKPAPIYLPDASGDLPGREKSFDEREKAFPADVRVRRDESDQGGPIVVELDENQIRKTPNDNEPMRLDDDEVME